MESSGFGADCCFASSTGLTFREPCFLSLETLPSFSAGCSCFPDNLLEYSSAFSSSLVALFDLVCAANLVSSPESPAISINESIVFRACTLGELPSDGFLIEERRERVSESFLADKLPTDGKSIFANFSVSLLITSSLPT